MLLEHYQYLLLKIVISGVSLVIDSTEGKGFDWFSILFNLTYALLNYCFFWLVIYCRKVLRETASGDRDSERVKLKLEIKVEVRRVERTAVLGLLFGSFWVL